MKSTYLTLALVLSTSIATVAQSRYMTLTINDYPGVPNPNSEAQLSIGTNEIGELVSFLPSTLVNEVQLNTLKNNVTNTMYPALFNHDSTGKPITPVVIAGPAGFQLKRTSQASAISALCTIKITPESFPPGQTIILPEGTVGTVHVESSTNLITWQDEWTQVFSNTNENRFFRLRAERSLP
jgi:hypothetical protein